MPLFSTWCTQQQLLFFVILPCTLKQLQLLVNCLEIFIPRLLSSNAQTSSHKTDWTFTDSVACFALPFLRQRKQSDECSRSQMFVASPFRDLYKCKHRCLHLLLYNCWYIFVYLFTILMLRFVVILSNTIICKQVCLLHCFIFVVFVCNYNLRHFKSKTPVSRFFIIVIISSICCNLLTIGKWKFYVASLYIFFFVLQPALWHLIVAQGEHCIQT